MEVDYEITPDFRVPEDKKHLLEGEQKPITADWDDARFYANLEIDLFRTFQE